MVWPFTISWHWYISVCTTMWSSILSICTDICMLWNMTTWYMSQLRKWTHFYFHLYIFIMITLIIYTYLNRNIHGHSKIMMWSFTISWHWYISACTTLRLSILSICTYICMLWNMTTWYMSQLRKWTPFYFHLYIFITIILIG